MTDSPTVTLFGVGTVVRSADGLVLVGRRRAEAGAPLAVPGGKPEAGEAGPRELEPGKFGSFRWIDPNRVTEGLFPATAALLERLRAR